MHPIVPANTCSYVGIESGNRCHLPANPNSVDGLCEGHSKEFDKSPFLLHQAVLKKILSGDCDFEGFLFPYRLNWNHLLFTSSVRFNRCIFMGGLRFNRTVFSGPSFRFDDCVFMEGSVSFSHCEFHSQATSFSGTVIGGEAVCFDGCSFTGSELDFRDTAWDVSKAIVFHRCQFRTRTADFSHSQWKAPLIAFQEPVAPSTPLRFHHTRWESDNLLMKRFHHAGDDVDFLSSSFDCKRVSLQLGVWGGKRFSLRNCRWKGDSFDLGKNTILKSEASLMQNRFSGKRFSLKGLRSTKGAMRFQFNQLSLDEEFDASRMRLNGSFEFTHNHVEAQLVRFNKIVSDGNEFRIEQSNLYSERFIASQSRFTDRIFSMARSTLTARQIDFRLSSFLNRQSSFQGVRFAGEYMSMQDVRFESERVSFQRSAFHLQKLSFERTRFYKNRVSFWKTNFGETEVYWKDAQCDDAQMLFETSLRLHSFRSAKLNHCDFGESEWAMSSGLFKRPVVFDENALMKSGRLRELVKLYRWISSQYRYSGNMTRARDFMYASQEIERLIQKRRGDFGRWLNLEMSKWMLGYGLGTSRTAIARTATALAMFAVSPLSKLKY